jgi:hypothetical protein
MTLVSTVTVGSGGAASISFTGIASTSTDIMVVLSGRNTSTTDAFSVSLNNDTTSGNYQYCNLYGRGSSTPGSGSSSGRFMGQVNTSSTTANTFSTQKIYFPNYASSLQKSFSSDWSWEDNATYNFMAIGAQFWTGTAAISTVTFTTNSNSWAEGSIASLYLITKGSGGATPSA